MVYLFKASSHKIWCVCKIETMKTSVVGSECESLQSKLFSGPQGQYLLRASEAEKGMVAARARSVTARLKISKFRGVRT